jgi:preprotein translocase subunit SecG
METIILVLHVLTAAAIIALVLLQHGKGADMGAAFGSGSAGSLFGSSGAANFLSRTTAVLAAVFFVSSLALTYFSGSTRTGGVTETLAIPAAPAAPKPASPATSAPAPAGGPQEKSSEIPK